MSQDVEAPFAWFGTLIEALPDGVAVTTLDGRILAVNEQLCSLSGYAREDLEGAPIEMLVPARFRAEHVAQRSAYVNDGGRMRPMSARLDITLVRVDKREVPVDVSLSTTGEGSERVVVAAVRDASARRESELARDREYRFLSAMSSITSALFSSGDVDRTLRAITSQARQLLEADLAALVMPDDNGGLRVALADGHGREQLEGTEVPHDASLAGLVMREREPMLLSDAYADKRFFRHDDWPDDIGPTLIVPLHARDEVLGTLTIANRRGGSMFRSADVTLMRSFAAQSAIAVLDGRNQVRLRLVEVLEDRERVAGRMRESVIKQVSSAALTLHALLEMDLPERARTRLFEVVDELDNAISAVRDALFPR
jgi:PAS domain S-box-containing protein